MSLKTGGKLALIALTLVSVISVSAGEVLASHNTQEQEEEPQCQCRARVSLDKPQYRWQDGTLYVTPVVDVSVRTRGDMGAPGWSANLSWAGETNYESDDVEVPAGTNLGGSKILKEESQCGRNRYSWSGLALPEVKLEGVTRDLVGDREELEGWVKMLVKIEGCGEGDEENRESKFRVDERKGFERTRVSSWRRVRA